MSAKAKKVFIAAIYNDKNEFTSERFITSVDSLNKAILICLDWMRESESIFRIELLDENEKPVWYSRINKTLPGAVRDKPRRKIISPSIIPTHIMFPTHEQKGTFIAYGYVLDTDNVPESLPSRTSVIVYMDIQNGVIETLNSIYEIV